MSDTAGSTSKPDTPTPTINLPLFLEQSIQKKDLFFLPQG